MLWTKSYETGNLTVDSQHKEIFRLVQQVIDLEFSTRKEKIHTAIDFLTSYTVRHFASEEKLMEESNYPKTAEHKKQHSDFAREVLAFKDKVVAEGDTLNISLQVNEIIVDWLTEHVLGSDRELADHYRIWSASR